MWNNLLKPLGVISSVQRLSRESKSECYQLPALAGWSGCPSVYLCQLLSPRLTGWSRVRFMCARDNPFIPVFLVYISLLTFWFILFQIIRDALSINVGYLLYVIHTRLELQFNSFSWIQTVNLVKSITNWDNQFQ